MVVNVCNLSDNIRTFVLGRAIFKSIVANFVDLSNVQVSILVTKQFICFKLEVKAAELENLSICLSKSRKLSILDIGWEIPFKKI